MAIAGLKFPPVTPVIDTLYQPGTPDVAEAVETTVALFKLLGPVKVDNEVVLRDSLTTGYNKQVELGLDGRLYPEVPNSVTTEQLEAAADRKRPRGVEKTYRWPDLWGDDMTKGVYTEAELNGSVTEATTRIAFFSKQPDDYDPLLHFRGVAFDDVYRDKGQPTQLELIEQEKVDFALSHAGFALQTLSHRDYLVLALMDRIRKVKPSDPSFVLNRGWMRVPEPGRKSVGSVSCVGVVVSLDGQLRFNWGRGGASGDLGVGLSAGLVGE